MMLMPARTIMCSSLATTIPLGICSCPRHIYRAYLCLGSYICGQLLADNAIHLFDRLGFDVEQIGGHYVIAERNGSLVLQGDTDAVLAQLALAAWLVFGDEVPPPVPADWDGRRLWV